MQKNKQNKRKELEKNKFGKSHRIVYGYMNHKYKIETFTIKKYKKNIKKFVKCISNYFMQNN